MITLRQRVSAIFNHAWVQYGRPVLTAVKPLAQWMLPAGFAYDATVDAVTDTAGTVLPNPADYWVTDVVYIVPTGHSAELRTLIAAGIVPAGTVTVYVLPADAATVRAAHAVEIAGAWYDVVEVADGPVGMAAWQRVELRRRS